MTPQEILNQYVVSNGISAQPNKLFKEWEFYVYSEGWTNPEPNYVRERLKSCVVPFNGQLSLVLNQDNPSYVEGFKLVGPKQANKSDVLIYDLATRAWEVSNEQVFLDLISLKGRRLIAQK